MYNKSRNGREGPPKFVSDACDMIMEVVKDDQLDEFLPDLIRRAKRGESQRVGRPFFRQYNNL
jgi:hypothetical protein